jgi:hypothetical protein
LRPGIVRAICVGRRRESVQLTFESYDGLAICVFASLFWIQDAWQFGFPRLPIRSDAFGCERLVKAAQKLIDNAHDRSD